jgi:probable rRNA maturation factor
MEPPGAFTVTERRWHVYVPDVARVVGRALAVAGCGADVVLTDDRGRNKPTNVLTYTQPPEILLGLGVVLREAREAGRSVKAHLAHLLIHGALHLAGFDHHRVGDARRMEAAEARLLARIRVANPWKNR